MTQTMKVIYNKVLPFPGYFAINLFGYMFVRDVYKDRKISKQTFNHEKSNEAYLFNCVGVFALWNHEGTTAAETFWRVSTGSRWSCGNVSG